MKTPIDSVIDIAKIFAERRVLEATIQKAERELTSRRNQLRVFDQQKKEKLARGLSSGQTTGNPLQDEIVSVFGADENAINKILAFNQELAKGKAILIAVHRRECFKHVMFPTPGNGNEYGTFTGYIYGIPSGERLIIRRTNKKTFWDTKVELPLKRYVKWGFRAGNTDTPVNGRPVFGENSFSDLNAQKFLSSVIDAKAAAQQLREMDPSDSMDPDMDIIIVSEVQCGKDPKKTDVSMCMALEQGQQIINVATPDERVAGAHI